MTLRSMNDFRKLGVLAAAEPKVPSVAIAAVVHVEHGRSSPLHEHF